MALPDEVKKMKIKKIVIADTEERTKMSLTHIRIYTRGQKVKGLPFQGEIMTCYICGAKHKSNPKEQSNWNAFTHKGIRVYLCPNCWSQKNLEKILHDLVKRGRRAIGA